MRRIIVPFSGGVTSAWCAGWALRNYPREEIILLNHDTKEEHPDTYRFIREMAEALRMSVVCDSDGRSVTEVFYDENALANNRMAFCSRILKAERGDAYMDKLRSSGVTEIIKVVGFSAIEPARAQRAAGHAMAAGYTVRFPVIEEKVAKQECADWCLYGMGVKPSEMYRWSDHANCIGCARGGKAYWLAVRENEPEIFEKKALLEEEFSKIHGYPIHFLKDISLRQLVQVGLKRKVEQRESIDIGPCECGD